MTNDSSSSKNRLKPLIAVSLVLAGVLAITSSDSSESHLGEIESLPKKKKKVKPLSELLTPPKQSFIAGLRRFVDKQKRENL